MHGKTGLWNIKKFNFIYTDTDLKIILLRPSK